MDDISVKSNKKRTQPKIICLPGQRLCLAEDAIQCGHGTYESMGYIHATLAGTVTIRADDQYKYIDVEFAGNQTVVPFAGDVVTARVQQVNPRFAKCAILSVGKHSLGCTYRAILRKEDVRSTEQDRVEMYKSFRPTDVILARVLPLTELTCYHLTTAENELGVVSAFTGDGENYITPMVPVSWTEMQCPLTLLKEPRKVAKILPEVTPMVED